MYVQCVILIYQINKYVVFFKNVIHAKVTDLSTVSVICSSGVAQCK